MQPIPRPLVWLAAMCAAGCGGGQSGPAAAAGPITTKVGEAAITYVGQPKRQVTSSLGAVTVLGQAGATFSTVTLEPPPNLDSTYLAACRNSGGQLSLYTYSYPAAMPRLLYGNTYNVQYPSVSANGTIAFGGSSSTTLASIRADGTGLTSIAFSGIQGGANSPFSPAYSIDGTDRLSFEAGSGLRTAFSFGLYVGPGTGGTASLVQSNSVGYGQAWNPAGTEIIYAAEVTGGHWDLFTTPAGGGAVTDVTPIALKGRCEIIYPAWSPDGVTIAASFVVPGSLVASVVVFNVNDPSRFTYLSPPEADERYPVFSPDGSKLAVYRKSQNGYTAGIYVEDAIGMNPKPTLFAADPSADVDLGQYGLSWSPFLPNETVVSSSGSTFYQQPASGFLLTQNGDQFGSFVAFTAKTPARASIQATPTGSGNPALAFTLTADSITSIGYMNNYFSAGTTMTLASTPSVVVAIDKITGQVNAVAPSSSPQVASVKNPDGTLTYKASFKAVYDGTGRNLTPNGASSLTVDPKSGRLVTFK